MLIRFGFWVSCMILSSLGLAAQSIAVVGSEQQADVKVYVVDHEVQADLLVYRERSRSDSCNEGRWNFVDYLHAADVKVCFVPEVHKADVIIKFVEYASLAGWRRPSKKIFFE